MAYDLHLHIIEKATVKMLTKVYAWQIPAVGEEIRISSGYWKVVQVVHCYDEGNADAHRANIGVEQIT